MERHFFKLSYHFLLAFILPAKHFGKEIPRLSAKALKCNDQQSEENNVFFSD